jgi:hypothetical protein
MGGFGPDDHYKAEVLSRHPNPLIASSLWFQENGAITEEEREEVLQFREHRNYIAYELPNVLLNPEVQVDEEKLIRLFQLLCTIDRWWIAEYEIPTHADFDGQDISPDEIRAGRMDSVALTSSESFTIWTTRRPSYRGRNSSPLETITPPSTADGLVYSQSDPKILVRANAGGDVSLGRNQSQTSQLAFVSSHELIAIWKISRHQKIEAAHTKRLCFRPLTKTPFVLSHA